MLAGGLAELGWAALATRRSALAELCWLAGGLTELGWAVLATHRSGLAELCGLAGWLGWEIQTIPWGGEGGQRRLAADHIYRTRCSATII